MALLVFSIIRRLVRSLATDYDKLGYLVGAES